MRDENGVLLMLSAAATPTDQDVRVRLFPEIAPELTVRWSPNVSGLCDTTAALLEFQVVATGQRFAVGPDQHYRFELGGSPYILAVAGVVGTPSSDLGYCGVATWVVFKEGFLSALR